MSVCSECHGGCCRRFYIDLTGYDMHKIHTMLELDYGIFTELIPVSEELQEEISQDAALFKFSNLDENFYRFVLKRIESPLIPDSRKCMFLQEWNSKTLELDKVEETIARCGIYSARPLICANFPARLDSKGVIGYVLDPINAKKKNKAAYNLCPRKLTKDDFADYSGEISKTLALRKYELEFFKVLAQEWNQDPKTVQDFLKFIDKVYKNRIMYEENI